MQKIILFILTAIILIAAGGWWWVRQTAQTGVNPPKTSKPATETNMKITSPVFEDGKKIPEKFTCDGENINPSLEISDVPTNAVSLALIVDDPDAPSGIWTHWLLWNIDPLTTSIAENSVPEGAVQGKTSFGQNVYGGPCPPSGVHHYKFKLFALDSKIKISSFSQSEDLQKAMQGHILAQAEMVGTYQK